MKYLTSFRTVLTVSRYLFRVLAFMLWSLGVLLTFFHILDILHKKESEVRQEYNLNFEHAQRYLHRSADIIRDLQYIVEKYLTHPTDNQPLLTDQENTEQVLKFSPLNAELNCSFDSAYSDSLRVLNRQVEYWKTNFIADYDLNRVFFISADNGCITEFASTYSTVDQQTLFKSLRERISKYRNTNNSDKGNDLYWVIPSAQQADVGYLYVMTPVYIDNKLTALLGIERTVRLDDLLAANHLSLVIAVLDENNEPQLRLVSGDGDSSSINEYPQENNYFGYADNYHDLILKKGLQPSSLSVVYALPVNSVVSRFDLLLNALLFNLFTAALLWGLVWLFERKIFLPTQEDAVRLEENEQFNRKIIASAPVGISILRISDGANILSNELAHNYINLLTYEDRERITRIIREQQVNLIDVITSHDNNLQISFVHSRYSNEDVAICVLADVSSRVKMEQSLQEIASAEQQANQSKSMFLATVSHELRTPLYGIIGNLDLLQKQALPQGVERLVNAMNNSSGMLLKIISDILDFSKIESEQLKIEQHDFSCQEVVTHIAGNYLPLVVKKRLGLYCFIEPGVPERIKSDPLRLQQVLSNLLSNAIKFTDTGCIILQVGTYDSYLEFSVRDTGIGIPEKEIAHLFDPFFQVGSKVQGHFQGTGLGLAICEKLVHLMGGDISVESEPGLGSLFTIRIPLLGAQFPMPQVSGGWVGKTLWLQIRNQRLERYLMVLLTELGARVMRHEEQEMAADDVLLSDYPVQVPTPLSMQVEFSIAHIGPSFEISPGYWLHSTAMPWEVIPLLTRLFSGEIHSDNPIMPPLVKDTEFDNKDINLLVVEDHPISRQLLTDQLTLLGYQVITANDGIDALGVLERASVDMVLTDVNMPRMDGYCLAQSLRQSHFTAPVIGITANALAEEKQRCIEAGMDNCLSKPVTLSVLEQTLAYYSQQVRRNRAENQPG
ncbi:two-component system sensor histidine kinase RcsC [Serratia sp. S1B]|nr:two-component system sensor histidine kinase RcsC [Serratia sp. S1B]